MSVIVTCAGPQGKWNNYLGVRSHFAPVGQQREPLLHRTVRQLHETGEEIHITCPPGFKSEYSVDGCETHEVEGSSEFDSTRHLWDRSGRTLLMLGDVYFSDLALRKMFALGAQRRYIAFGRYSASRVTGCKWGELFAHSFWPNQFDMLDHNLQIVSQAKNRGINRPTGWMLLRSIQGTPMGRHIVKQQWFHEINDWTDDIDFPDDYANHPATRYNL